MRRPPLRGCPFAGELGWEVHAPNASMPTIYDAILAAGAKPFGMYALNSLRLGKGLSCNGKVICPPTTRCMQGGLERFVKWDKEEFRGKTALQGEKQQGVSKTVCDAELSTLTTAMLLTCQRFGMMGKWSGETTSGGYGHRINASVALGMVQASLAEPGTELEVEIYGKRHRAVVQQDRPLWDPENERIRA